jgi:ABC-2 type transport system permease protein
MTAFMTIRLLAARELQSRAKAFRISTGLLVSVAAIGGVVLRASGVDLAAVRQDEAGEVLAFLGTVALFMALISYGQVLLFGVAEEKSSRVVEVVLGAVKAEHLLAAKVIGIGLFALGQIVVTAGVFVVIASAAGGVSLPTATWTTVLSVSVWFVLGFAFYASVYAAAASLLAPHQNPSNAAGPINMVLMIGYWLALISIPAGSENIAVRVASLLPPLAPLTMPLRMVQGTASGWEMALALASTVAGVYLVIRLSARIYRAGLMRAGKTTWRQAWHSSATM